MTLLVLLYLLYLLERRVVWRRVHFSTGTGCLQNSPTRYISEGSRRDKHESNTDRVLHVEQKTDCIITLAVVCYLSHYHTIRAKDGGISGKAFERGLNYYSPWSRSQD